MISEILTEKKVGQIANTSEARLSLVGEEIFAAIPYDGDNRMIYVLNSGYSFELDFITLGFVVRNPNETQKALTSMIENIKPIMETSNAITESLELIKSKQVLKQKNKGGANETSENVVQG